MYKLQKIIYRLGYYEWIIVISLLTLLALTTIFFFFYGFAMLLLICLLFIPFIFVTHNGNFNFDSNKLSKYKISYHVINIEVGGKTYYIPVAQFISKYGYLYKFIIIYYRYSSFTDSLSLDNYNLNCRLEQIKEDPVKEIESCRKDRLLYEKKEDALYVIKRYREIIEEDKAQRDKVNISSTSVNFNNK